MRGGVSPAPRTWSSGPIGGTGALPRPLTARPAPAASACGERVEDQVRARQHAGVLALPAPLHDAVGTDHHERALRHAALLVVDAERSAGRALRLPVGQLLDCDAELLLERPLRLGRVARDAIERGALRGEAVQHLLVEVELVRADGAERKRIEDEDRRVSDEILVREASVVLATKCEVGRGSAG